MTAPPPWLDAEDALANDTVAALASLVEEEQGRKVALSDKLRQLLADRQDASDDPIQQHAIDQAINEVERERKVHERANRVRDLDASSPYFGHLTLEEDGRQREVLIGKGSAVDRRLPANIVDWRNAPISRLYYEYEEEDEYAEEIAGREREGTIVARRTLDVRGGVLQSVETRGLVARKRAGGVWEVRDKEKEVLERSDLREDPEDHALPDIVALISPEQFAVLSKPDSGVVILRGQAGSGKTTVALHRIAYLRYHDAERFRPERVLVVMFNKALQTYIQRALKDLDIAGVRVSTFHAWASGMLRRGGFHSRFSGGAPPAVTRIKQHPAIDGLLAATVDRLGDRLEAWLDVPEPHAAAWEGTEGRGLARVGAFFRSLPDGALEPLLAKVRRRLADHTRDLYTLFEDASFARAHLPSSLHTSLATAARHQATLRKDRVLDFADAALILRLGQLIASRGGLLRPPWHHAYAHIVADEAQDLSAPAIRVLLDAADARQSVTLAGDPAQTLYGAGTFGLLADGHRALGQALELDTLPVGHRSTRPILELALQASGHEDPDLLARTRNGHPVTWLRKDLATPARVAAAIHAFRSRRPKSLVAVLTRSPKDADAWHRDLRKLEVPELRRGHRDQFGFGPGTVVSNVHQVKGLEFDGVVLIEPGAYPERDRNLLHVAITRAADQLWVVSRGGSGLIEEA